MQEPLSLSPVSSLQPSDPSGRADVRGEAARGEPAIRGSADEKDNDQVDISAHGRGLVQKQKSSEGNQNKTALDSHNKTNAEGLTAEQQQQVAELAEGDRQVRSHELAHMSAGGSLVRGGPTYTFRTGPDGKRYAVAGEVNIDVSPVKNDPAATIRKGYRVRAAALAPADPSPQDRQVAANADEMITRAQMEKINSQRSGTKKSTAEPASGVKKSRPASLLKAGIAAD